MTSKLDAIEAALAEATVAPWSYNGTGGYVCFLSIDDGRPRNYISAPQAPGMSLSAKDACAIVLLRNNATAIIRALKAAQSIFSEEGMHEMASCYSQYGVWAEAIEELG